MKIFLLADKKVRDVRKEFEREFRYLKIDFIRKIIAAPGIAPKIESIPPNSKLIDISRVMREGEIEIRGNQTACEIKQVFESKFYLPVRIYRKSMNGVIDISQNDQLILAKQNRMGREACNAIYDAVVLL